MAYTKNTRGGRRGTSGVGQQPTSAKVMPADEVLQAINDGDTINVDSFMALTDDEKADAIASIIKQDIPNFLDNGDFQKILYYTEVEGKPQIVSDSALDQMSGKDLFRTVVDAYDKKTDVNYTSKQIYNQIAKGDFTMVSSSGGSAYGKGIYFADSYRSSASYGRGGKNPLIMRAKLNGNARKASYDNIETQAVNEIRSGSKLGKVLGKMRAEDAISAYAFSKGYNVIEDKYSGYYVVLDRKALTMSSRTKPATGYSW